MRKPNSPQSVVIFDSNMLKVLHSTNVGRVLRFGSLNRGRAGDLLEGMSHAKSTFTSKDERICRVKIT